MDHPGVESSDLYHEVHYIQVGERGPYPGTADREQRYLGMKTRKVLCHNCNWNSRDEIASHYTSRVKLAYIGGGRNSAIWDLGPNGPWMLKDTTNSPTDLVTKDYTTQKILRKRIPSLPLVEMHKFEGPGDKFNFIVMARAKGDSMAKVWHTLTWEQKSDVLLDLKKHIREWRQVTSPRMWNLDGSELVDGFIGSCTGFGCIKTGQNEEEWLENLTPAVRKGILSNLWFGRNGWTKDQKVLDSWVEEADEKVAKLMGRFPRGGPYVLTHCDLHSENVFISNDNAKKKWEVSAIIDWELAGFYPWWVESFRTCLEACDPKLISEYNAEDFCHPGYTIEDFKGISQAVIDVKEAWNLGGNHTMSKHGLDQANVWRRQPFCACQPYSQTYEDGYDQEHIDVFDPDSEDSQDEKDDRDKKFPKRHRQFLRWFKQIHERK